MTSVRLNKTTLALSKVVNCQLFTSASKQLYVSLRSQLKQPKIMPATQAIEDTQKGEKEAGNKVIRILNQSGDAEQMFTLNTNIAPLFSEHEPDLLYIELDSNLPDVSLCDLLKHGAGVQAMFLFYGSRLSVEAACLKLEQITKEKKFIHIMKHSVCLCLVPKRWMNSWALMITVFLCLFIIKT